MSIMGLDCSDDEKLIGGSDDQTLPFIIKMPKLNFTQIKKCKGQIKIEIFLFSIFLIKNKNLNKLEVGSIPTSLTIFHSKKAQIRTYMVLAKGDKSFETNMYLHTLQINYINCKLTGS